MEPFASLWWKEYLSYTTSPPPEKDLPPNVEQPKQVATPKKQTNQQQKKHCHMQKKKKKMLIPQWGHSSAPAAYVRKSKYEKDFRKKKQKREKWE